MYPSTRTPDMKASIPRLAARLMACGRGSKLLGSSSARLERASRRADEKEDARRRRNERGGLEALPRPVCSLQSVVCSLQRARSGHEDS
jgi:hypothetical protein